MKNIALPLYLLAALIPEVGWPATCEQLFSGTWIISSHRIDGITAVDSRELKRIESKKVNISNGYIRSGFGICRVGRIEYDSGNAMVDGKSFNIICSNDVVMPSFEFHNSCKILSMELDGVSYTLRRANKARR